MGIQKGRSVWIVAAACGLSAVVAFGAALEGPFVAHGTFGQANAPQPTQSLKAHANVAQPKSTGSSAHGATLDVSWVVWLLVAVGITVVALVIFRLLRRRFANPDRRETQFVDATALEDIAAGAGLPDAHVIRRGLDAAAERLDDTRVPRDAIILAWLGLQEAAEDSGVARRGPETPTEFTSRVFTTLRSDGTRVDMDAARDLLSLYLRARFDMHPTSEQDVAAARSALARLSESWPRPELLEAQASAQKAGQR